MNHKCVFGNDAYKMSPLDQLVNILRILLASQIYDYICLGERLSRDLATAIPLRWSEKEDGRVGDGLWIPSGQRHC